jgi:hypothetical protein
LICATPSGPTRWRCWNGCCGADAVSAAAIELLTMTTHILTAAARIDDAAAMDWLFASIPGGEELREPLSTGKKELAFYDEETRAGYYGGADGTSIICWTVPGLTPEQYEAIKAEFDAMTALNSEAFQDVVGRTLGGEIIRDPWDPTLAVLYHLRPPPHCADCPRQAHPYMVTNEIWEAVGMTFDEGQHLCIPCLEKRLRRPLVSRDFQKGIDGIQNAWIQWRGGRLKLRPPQDAWVVLRRVHAILQ